MDQAKARYRALDACRGFCAVAVMLFHMDALTHFYAWPFIRNAYVAVDFFFVLSGFVIASAYADRLTTWLDVGRFSLRRFGRLYPLHAAVLLIYVLIEWAALPIDRTAFTGHFSVPALFCNIFLIQGFGAFHESWNYPAWSISVELWVNFAFALYLFTLRRWSVRLIALVLAAAGGYVALNDALPFQLSEETGAALTDVAQSVFGFALGALLVGAVKRARAVGWRPGWLAESIAVALIALVFGARDSIPDLASPLCFAVVVFVFAFESGPISKFLVRPACVRLGTISYSIYLTHSLYLLLMAKAVIALAGAMHMRALAPLNGDDVLVFGGIWSMDAITLLCVIVALIGSNLTYRYIEEPARLFSNALSNGESVRVAWARGVASAA